MCSVVMPPDGRAVRLADPPGSLVWRELLSGHGAATGSLAGVA
jgi:hypothetical protein